MKMYPVGTEVFVNDGALGGKVVGHGFCVNTPTYLVEIGFMVEVTENVTTNILVCHPDNLISVEDHKSR